jgi:hypothetical protein
VSVDTVRETVRDTFKWIEADTSNFWALIECNERNEAYIRELQNNSTTGLKTVLKWKHDTLIVTTTVDSQKVYFNLKEKYLSKTDKAEVVRTEIVHKLFWWWWIVLVLAAIVGGVVNKYVGKVINIKNIFTKMLDFWKKR